MIRDIVNSNPSSGVEFKWLKDVKNDPKAVEAVKSMLIQHWPEEFDGMHIDEYPEQTLVGFVDGKPVATAGVCSRDDPDPALPEWLYLTNVVVLPEYRNRKLADLMVTYLTNMVTLQQNEDLYLICADKMIPMYEKYGYNLLLKKYHSRFKRDYNIMVKQKSKPSKL